ncbi:hypothetical protein [Northern red-backed vole stool-associated circular virus 116]|uniref:Uncharacterized protein n=1 Tax=Northern red-backed vole stool-associated circular virus 116 TaxID=2714165 RepID=A0AAE6X4T1_9VIRU|nr:hypothetical protein QKQ83_gp2 [Northern red-backed vole stool-associated circular virus 116]QIK03938.1 hypothetical protein [Northern red-backed vole stool-associated circular virus 116]
MTQLRLTGAHRPRPGICQGTPRGAISGNARCARPADAAGTYPRCARGIRSVLRWPVAPNRRPKKKKKKKKKTPPFGGRWNTLRCATGVQAAANFASVSKFTQRCPLNWQ